MARGDLARARMREAHSREQELGVRLRPHAGRTRSTPTGMSRLEDAPPEAIAAVRRIAVGVFADMCNAGWSLQEAVTAVYVSGLQHGSELGSRVVGGES